MSVVGFDLGNESCIVAVARQRGIDVVLNDESKSETPAIMCFGDKQQFIGTVGDASSTMNPKNSISQIKRLIGRQFSDPELQKDLKSLPFTVTGVPDWAPISLSWKGTAPETQNETADNQQSTIVFPKGNPIPSVKALTFYRSGTFTVDVQYADVIELHAPAKISTYTLLEEEEVEVHVAKEPGKEAAKMETEEAPSDAPLPSSNETDVNMQDAKGTSEAPGAENGVPESGDKPAQMETDKVKSQQAKEKRAKNTYNHHLGSTGYSGMLYRHKLKTGTSKNEIDRSDAWIMARKDKDGNLQPAVAAIEMKISDLKSQVEEGSFHSQGPKDILTEAIQKQPNGSRVQGIGQFITPSMYFQIPESSEFAMKYMQQIVTNVNILKDNFKGINEYTLEDITQLRDDWAIYVAHIITQCNEENTNDKDNIAIVR